MQQITLFFCFVFLNKWFNVCTRRPRGERRRTKKEPSQNQRLTHSEQPVLIIQYGTLITWPHTPGALQYDKLYFICWFGQQSNKNNWILLPLCLVNSVVQTATHPFYYVCLRAFKRIPQETERISEGGIRQEEWIYLMGLMDTRWR